MPSRASTEGESNVRLQRCKTLLSVDEVAARRNSIAADVARKYGLTVRTQGTQRSSQTLGSIVINPIESISTTSSRTVVSLAKANSCDMPAASSRRFTFVVQHWLFTTGINCLVILAIIHLGLEHECSGYEFKIASKVWEILYTVISTIEVICMIEVYRCQYFQTRWMLIDFVVAVASILDTTIFLFIDSAEFSDYFQWFRLLRVIRIVKVTKLFPEFAVILEGLRQSFQSMFWIFGLLLLILYAGSICCVSVLGGPDAGFPDYNEGSVKLEVLKGFNNYEYFGTLFRSMMTLLSMLLLSEWGVARKIAEVHIGMVPLFLLMLVLVTFGVTNVIIGIVVEKTIEAMKLPVDADIVQEMENKAEMSLELAQMLYNLDLDGDGRISLDELEQGLQRPELAKKMDSLNLPYGFTAAELLHMLDLNGDGQLSEYEFSIGLLRLISSSDWQRQCLHAMEIGMLHRSMTRLRGELKMEFRKSVCEIQSEIRMCMKSNTERPYCWSSSELRRDHSADSEARPLTTPWEPLPKAPVFSVAGQEREVNAMPEAECLSSNDTVAEQARGIEHKASAPYASVSSEEMPPQKVAAFAVAGQKREIQPLPQAKPWPSNYIAEGQTRGVEYAQPQAPLSSEQRPRSETTIRTQMSLALEHGSYDSLHCGTHDRGHDVGGFDHVSPMERKTHWI